MHSTSPGSPAPADPRLRGNRRPAYGSTPIPESSRRPTWVGWAIVLLAASLLPGAGADRPLNYELLTGPIRFLPTPITDVALVGSRIYLGLETNLVQEIEWSTEATRKSRPLAVPHPSRRLAFAQGVLAVTDLERSITLVDLAGEKPSQTLALPSPASQMAFARDRLFVATADGGLLEVRNPTVLAVPAEIRELVAPDPAPGKSNQVSRFAADRSILVYARNRRDLATRAVEVSSVIVDLSTGRFRSQDDWSKVPGALTPVFLANGFAYFAYDDPGDATAYYLVPLDVSDPEHPVSLSPLRFGSRTGPNLQGPQILPLNQRTLLTSEGSLWDCPNPQQLRRLGEGKLDKTLTLIVSTNTLVGFDPDRVLIHRFTNSPLDATQVAFYGARHAFALGVQGDFGYFPTGRAAFPDTMGPVAIYSGLSSNQPVPYAWMLRPSTNPPTGPAPADSPTNFLWACAERNFGVQISTYRGDTEGLLHLQGILDQDLTTLYGEKLRVTGTRVSIRGEIRTLEIGLRNGVPILQTVSPPTAQLPAFGSPTAGVVREMDGFALFRPDGFKGIAVRSSTATNPLVVLPATDAMLIDGRRALAAWTDGTLRLLSLRDTELFASPWPGVTIQGARPADPNRGFPTILRDEVAGRNIVRSTPTEFRVYDSCPRNLGYIYSSGSVFSRPGPGSAILRSDRFEGAMLAFLRDEALRVVGLDSPNRGDSLLNADRIDGASVRFLALASADPGQAGVRVIVQRGNRYEWHQANLRLPTRPVFERLLDLGPTNSPPPLLARTPRAGAALFLWPDRLAFATVGSTSGWSISVGKLPEPAVDCLEWGNQVLVASSHRLARVALPGTTDPAPLPVLDRGEIPEGVAGLYSTGHRAVVIDLALGARLLEPGPAGELIVSERLSQGEFVGALWDGDQTLLLGTDERLHSVASWGRPWIAFSNCTRMRLSDTQVFLSLVGTAATRVSLEQAESVTGPWSGVGELQLDADGRGQLVVPRQTGRFVVYRSRVLP